MHIIQGGDGYIPRAGETRDYAISADIRKLKEIVPSRPATIQMEFSENYVCCMNGEMKSAYFDRHQVRLDSMVMH